jgi:ATP-binding cassette, subfamily C, bacterial
LAASEEQCCAASYHRIGYGTVRAFVTVLFQTLPRKGLLALALLMGVGVMEWLGLLLLVSLLALVGLEPGQGSVSGLVELTRSGLARLGLPPTLTVVLGCYVASVAVRAGLQRWQALAITDLESSFVRSLRKRLFDAILHTRWAFVSGRRSSDLLHTLTNQVSRVGHATDHLLPMAAQLIVITVYLLFAVAVSPAMTAVVSTAGVGLLILLRPESRKAFSMGDRLSMATGRLYGGVMEQLSGLKTTRSYRAEERTAAFFDALQQDVVATEMATQRNFARVRLGFDVGAVLVLSLMLWLSVEVLSLAVAEVLLLIYLFGRLVPRLAGIQQSQQYFVNALPAFRDVMRVIAECEAECEPGGQVPGRPIMLQEEIRLRQVSFRYRPEGRPVIDRLDLSIPAHRTTAIVGPSGAGKTTIADLVLGLITPERGHVLVDGVPLGPGTLRAWREQIGYVAQDNFLFHDTIRANLLWARPEATEGELRKALGQASAESFVSQLPLGLDTVVGDRGVLLAGGERQRLALARALLRRPALLILDEATSSLDSENERHIQQALGHLHGSVTILVIAHRLATIRDADAVHVLEAGRIVESGSWNDLTRTDGRFLELCRAQGLVTGHAPAEEPAFAALARR